VGGEVEEALASGGSVQVKVAVVAGDEDVGAILTGGASRPGDIRRCKRCTEGEKSSGLDGKGAESSIPFLFFRIHHHR
jgi:hypothetical protein